MSESTQEQAKHGLSVDSQIIALQEFAKENRMDVIGIYNDAGHSANKRYTTRPALVDLLKDCEQGKIDQILFTKLDRWFRLVSDYYEVQSILDRNHVTWRSIWEDYETETSSGVFKVNIMLSVAQNEADRTKERVRSAFDYKRARGDYVGKAPTGYLVRGRDLIIDPDKEEGMKAFFAEYLTSFSTKQAMDKASEYGVTFDRIHIQKLMKNPVYCGEASGGYQCTPYITKEEHQKIIDHIGHNPRRPKVEGRTYLFSGILYCGYCGRRLAGQTIKRIHSDGSVVHWIRYGCNQGYTTKMEHPHIQASESVLERYLLASLDDLIANRRIEVESMNDDSSVSESIKRKKALEAKLSRLAILFEDGDMDAESYRTKRDAIKDEMALIHIEPIKEPDPLPEDWRMVYDALDPTDRRSFWMSLIKSITFTNANKDHPDIEFL